jgi:PadR family transcriptional regulator, regulatory protein PadR
MLKDFFTGFVKMHILHHAAIEPIYGLAMMAELRRHGYEIGPGTLYPILHQMEKAGYLAREDRPVNGKIRKYYTATDRGEQVLVEARHKIAELVTEVVEGHGPTTLPIPLDERMPSIGEGAENERE